MHNTLMNTSRLWLKRILVPVLLVLTTHALASANEDASATNPSLQVVQTSFNTVNANGTSVVTVLGDLKNTSNTTRENLVVEAKLFDSSGKLVDVISQPVYGLLVPANQQVAFRLQAPVAALPDAYASVQARVVSAEPRIEIASRPSSTNYSRVWSMLGSWGPMLLLIGAWFFLTRKYNGKGSAQDKMLHAIEVQNQLLERQIAAIEALASPAASRNP